MKTIDKVIFAFLILFLATLTNSIFLNQLGYYGALVFLIVKSFLNKENQFSKTGLEYVLLFYIAAEIISTIFSSEPGHSFHNLLKRVLLIPIIYVFGATVKLPKFGKIVYRIFIGFAIIGCLLYLGASISYYINNLYQSEQSGPSVFQYPITASEIMSFTVVFLFAFLINEQQSIKKKIPVIIGFAIASLALLATYKRTGWMGAAAGILFVLILSRKWFLLTGLTLAIVVVFLIQKNTSEVFVFDSSKHGNTYTITTQGRAWGVLPDSASLIVADYEEGLLTIKDQKITGKIKFDSPVTSIDKFDSFYIATLLDTRFVIFKKDAQDQIVKTIEIITPGLTTSYSVFQNHLYILDRDSGLTVISLADFKKTQYKNIIGFEYISVDSVFVVLHSPAKGMRILKRNDLQHYTNINDSHDDNVRIKFLSPFLFICESSGTLINKRIGDSLVFISNQSDLKNIQHITTDSIGFYLCDVKGNVFNWNLSVSTSGKPNLVKNIGFAPTAFAIQDGTIFASRVKQSRLSSFTDPYNPSNLGRFAFWGAGLRIFMDHPFFGVGDIDLAPLYTQYKRPFDKEIQGHMHNNYVHILVTLGAFGFIAFLFLIGSILYYQFIFVKESKGIPFVSSFSLGAFACIIAFLISGLTEWNFGDHEIITMVWFIVGMSMGLRRVNNEE